MRWCDLHAHGPGSSAACRLPSNANRMPQAQVYVRLLQCTEQVAREYLTCISHLPAVHRVFAPVGFKAKMIVLGRVSLSLTSAYRPEALSELNSMRWRMCACDERAKRVLHAWMSFSRLPCPIWPSRCMCQCARVLYSGPKASMWHLKWGGKGP